MGVSTDGILVFGIPLEEGAELPWGEEEIDSWWLKETGFKPSVQVYDEDGEYLPEVLSLSKKDRQVLIDKMFAEQKEWAEKNPCPVYIEMHCSCEYPMYIISVPDKRWNNNRGYATVIDPNEMKVTEQEAKAIKDFIEKYDLPVASDYEHEDPKWLLVSMWG